MRLRGYMQNNASARKTTMLAVAFMGLGHLVVLRNWMRGLFLAACEVLFIIYCPHLLMMIGRLQLGSNGGVNSIFSLIDGIVAIAIVVLFFCIYVFSVKDVVRCMQQKDVGCVKHQGNAEFIAGGLLPAVILIVFFIIVPLVFSAAVAFTDYAAPNHLPPSGTVNWVGFSNFKTLVCSDMTWAQSFGRVATWTLIWGTASTVTCYLGGFVMAVLLKNYRYLFSRFFNIVFLLPYAVPSALSMIVWQNLLNGSFGVVNRTLINLHLIQTPIPWLSDSVIAKFVCLAVNLWAGFPYFMLLVSGAMTAIPQDMYEAAKIDGATSWQLFCSITFPLVTYQTMPLLIMSFAHNINNFGAVFFLTGGNPSLPDSTVTSAGGTDILVSWIYKLTVNLMQYNYASVLSIVIFIVLVPISVFNFRRTQSFKKGEF